MFTLWKPEGQNLTHLGRLTALQPSLRPKCGSGVCRWWGELSYHKHRDLIFRKYQAKCWVCGKFGSEVDHVVPRSLGGSDHPDNLRPICSSCNKGRNRKGSSHGYSKLPSVEAVCRKGSIAVYRGKVEITPRMFQGGVSLERRVREAQRREQYSPGYLASRALVRIGQTHTDAARKWVEAGQSLFEFVVWDDECTEGLHRRLEFTRKGIKVRQTDQTFFENHGKLQYKLIGEDLPADWDTFHFDVCPICSENANLS